MPYDYKTKYTNSEGNTIPALADIEYKTKDWFLGKLFGMSRNVRNGEVPTDTVVTLSPQVPGAALHKINLSGKNSTYSKFNESDGTFYRNTEHQNYFVPVAREAVENAQPRSFKEKFIGIKQQGGQLSPEQQELQYALLGYVVATKKQPKDENEINQIAQQLIQLKQQDPNKYNQLVQLGQQAQAQKAEKGAKINYLKKLKGQCPEGEELVYFKKGGMLDCGCQKKQNGGEVKKPKENKKSNPIEEFKKGRKTKKC